jgi:Arylsulfotransferase (ASST)
MRVLMATVLAGCSDNDGGTNPTEPTDSGTTPTPTDTGTTGGTETGTTPTTSGPPTSLEVTCTPTANVLRYLCSVTVDPPQPVQLTFVRADGLSPARTVEGPASIGQHELGLYFMAPEQAYDVTVAATAWPDKGAATKFTTGVAPAKVASSLSMTGTSTMGLIGTHLPCDTDAIGVVYDTHTGDLVWFHLFEGGGTFGANDMLAFTDDFTVLGESEGTVVEVDLMGNDLVRLPDLSGDFGIPSGGIFGNFHHDITKRNGIYYVIYQEDFPGFDVLDGLVLFDASGTELTRWHAEDHLDLPSGWSGDFLHTNSVYVDAAGDIYLSWLGQAMIAKLDGDLASPTFGDPIWQLDGESGGGLTTTIATDFSGVGAPGSFEDQHSVILRADGRVQLLDNNNGRALVIAVDEKTNTATVDAEFATFENACSVQGTSRSTVAGNPVVGCLGDTVREYDITTEQMLWQAEVQCQTGPAGGSSRFYPLDGW